MRTTVIASAMLLLACDGGGIAGAGFDRKAVVEEAETYQAFVAPFVRESISPTCDKDIEQHFEQMFRQFRANYPRIEGQAVHIELGNTVAWYRNNLFEVQTDGKSVITEQLPAAFYMHPMSMGIHSVGGREIIMISNVSRATTGLYFVGIYGTDGTPYYKQVLSAADVWDVRVTEEHIEIVGHCDTRQISFEEPNNRLQRTLMDKVMAWTPLLGTASNVPKWKCCSNHLNREGRRDEHYDCWD